MKASASRLPRAISLKASAGFQGILYSFKAELFRAGLQQRAVFFDEIGTPRKSIRGVNVFIAAALPQWVIVINNRFPAPNVFPGLLAARGQLVITADVAIPGVEKFTV